MKKLQFFFFTFFIFNFNLVYSQANLDETTRLIQEEECENYTPPPHFTGDTPPTLCDRFGWQEFLTEIGEGTSFPTSSSLGKSISGNVHIVGNFTIDESFEFLKANVKIAGDKGIFVQGDNILTVNSSNLFACDKMWLGIKMESSSSIVTKNKSTIEDAAKTIDASNEAYVTLDLSNTTFNRNLNNIYIDNSLKAHLPPHIVSHTPYFKSFTNLVFSCTSPLIGTVDEITYSGVFLDYCPMLLPAMKFNSRNTFTDIKIGIYAKAQSLITASNLDFTKIRISAIHAVTGLMELDNCKFIDNKSAIDIKYLDLCDLENCIFRMTSAFVGKNGSGIDIDELNTDANLLINTCNFNVDFGKTGIVEHKYQDIYIKGSIVGVNNVINISKSDFIASASPRTICSEVTIKGDFPE